MVPRALCLDRLAEVLTTYPPSGLCAPHSAGDRNARASELLNEADAARFARGCGFALPPAAWRSRSFSAPYRYILGDYIWHNLDYQTRYILTRLMTLHVPLPPRYGQHHAQRLPARVPHQLTARNRHRKRVAATTQRDKTHAVKEIEKIDKILNELRAYEGQVLYPLATQQVEIDLDDGGKVNYNKLGKALAHVRGVSGQW